MAEGRDIKGVVGSNPAAIPWWQAGSKQKKPNYFYKDPVGKFLKSKQSTAARQNEKTFQREQVLIKDRNRFYAQYKDMPESKIPKYSFEEAFALYGRGYSGVFGRSKDNQSISLLGQPWQQAYALKRLRQGKQMLDYGVVNTQNGTDAEETRAYKELAAADRTAKTWSGLMDLYKDWGKLGGEAGYRSKYGDGDLPGEGSKYAIMYNMNNRAVKKDDIQATYQHNLSESLRAASKQFNRLAEDAPNDGAKQDFLQLASVYAAMADDGKISVTEKRADPNPEKVRAMEAALKGMGKSYDDVVEKAIGAPAPSFSKSALKTTLSVAGGPMYGALLSTLMDTDKGQQIANNALGRMQALQTSQGLAARKVRWDSPKGFGDFSFNVVTGLAQFGIGLMPGAVMMADEGIKALAESKKAPKQALAGLAGTAAATGTLGFVNQDAVTNKILDGIGTDEREWGQGVDFQLGDAIWSDFAQRYYDPFAYGKGKDGKEEFQGFWHGLRQPDDWADLGNKIGEQPVSYALDLLDVFPVVGWAAKGASVASVAAKAGRLGRVRVGAAAAVADAEIASEFARAEFVAARRAVNDNVADIPFDELTDAEKAAWREEYGAWKSAAADEYRAKFNAASSDAERAALRAKYPNRRISSTPAPKPSEFAAARVARESATDILDAVRKNPDLIEVLDEAQIQEAAKVLEDVNALDESARILDEAEATLLETKARLDQIPSVRTFRKVARMALAGDPGAQRQVGLWKAMGFDFNGAESTRALRFSAQFEPRTKVLEPFDPNLPKTRLATVRLPASPLARGIKNGMYWVGRVAVDPALQRLDRAGQASSIDAIGRLTSKMVDMPVLGYRWNYTRAVEQSLMDNWGDMASEMRLASETYKLQANADLKPETRAAILSELYGGTGPVATNAPMLRRQAILDKLNDITVNGNFKMDNDFNIGSEFIRGTEDQAEALLTEYRALLDDEIRDLDKAAESFDVEYSNRRSDIRRRLADPDYGLDDPELDAAVEVYRRMEVLREKISHRIVHTETNPHNIAYLEHLYTEAMNSLRILPDDLFGEDGRSGRLGAYVTRTVKLNNAIQPLLHELGDMTDDAIIEFAQSARKKGTVWERVPEGDREAVQADWLRFVRDMTNNGDGIFRRGDAGPNDVAAPVVVKAKDQKGVPRGFTRVHVPRIRQTIDNGVVSVGRLIDPDDAYTIPNEFLVTKKTSKKGARSVVTLDAEDARNALRTGSLNAMSDIYPNARFYSEKVSESGMRGTRENEKRAKNDHVVATTALREHSLAQAIRSEVVNYRFRMQDQLVRQAEENAILVPAEQVVGKSSRESGYKVLGLVRAFDDIEEARFFAKARGVESQFDEALAAGPQRVNGVADANPGLSIMNINGEDRFVVRGTIDDWAKYSQDEDLTTHTIMQDYKSRVYDDPARIPTRGYVLAVPNIVDEKLSLMVIEGNTYATRLLERGIVKAPTSAFKRVVLNFRPGFIESNVLGGATMLMMRNPMAAGKILARVIAKNAKMSGDNFVANFAGDSKAVDRQLAMEYEHNVYRNDAGIAAPMREPESVKDFTSGGVSGWLKKYVWNGGYTTVAAFERAVRNAVAIDFLTSDPTFRAFMDGPEVARYIDNGVDYYGSPRPKDGPEPISKFEAATDLLLDRSSPFFNNELKYRMRYATNTVSGNYHRFAGWEQLLRNFAMPFYAWQRHSLAYTWRMAVDKPITANALYHIGQAGYAQVAEQGLPDYMRETIPVPQVVKDYLGVTEDDFRIDVSNLNPFGTTTQLMAALYSVITGENTGESIFRFANPYLNNLIKDTLGIDPVTKQIDWERLSSKDQNGNGIVNTTWDMFKNIGKGTYAGSFMRAKDVVDNDYENDALANMYPAIDTAEEAEKILRNMYTMDANGQPVSKGMKGWQLSIPKPRTADQKNRAVDMFNAMGFRTYMLNADTLAMQSRDEFVAGMALSFYNNKAMSDKAASTIRRLTTWKQNKRFVEEYWAPRARKAGVPEATIQLVLNKIMLEKPKGTSNVDPNLLLNVIGG